MVIMVLITLVIGDPVSTDARKRVNTGFKMVECDERRAPKIAKAAKKSMGKMAKKIST